MLIDGPEIGRSRVGGRGTYFKIGAVAVLAVSVLAIGYLGPHVNERKPAPTPSASNVASNPVVSRRSAAPTATSPTMGLGELEAAMGLPFVENPPDEIVSLLPLQISAAPAIGGHRLFFVVSGTMLESAVIGSKADPVTLATVPRCQEINQIAAAGNAVMYLVTWPEPPNPTATLCATFSRIHWSLRLLDLRTGASHEVAAGTRPKIGPEVDGFPIRFSITTSAYAFDRPDDAAAAAGPETIEVHELSGARLWATDSPTHVEQLELGQDDTLAVTTQESWPNSGIRTVWIASRSAPTLQRMGETRSFLSVSTDGRYVVWDTTLRMGLNPDVATADVAISDMRQHVVRSAFPGGGKDQIQARNPAVLSTSNGPLVAWLALGPDLVVYPSFNWPGRGRSGFLQSAQAPLWIAFNGDSLVWVAESSDGWSAVLYSVSVGSL